MSTVFIADDHELIRKSVCALLEGHSTIEICGEARDGQEALEKVQELRPDIVLLDIEMPRLNGIQAAKEIHRILPGTKVVLFTIHPLSLYQESALSSQAFVSKLAAETDLIPALNRLLQSNPEGLNGPLRYRWQSSVWDSLASAPDSVLAKIEIAQHAIAARLTDLCRPDRNEQIALDEALRALGRLVSETTSSQVKTQRM